MIYSKPTRQLTYSSLNLESEELRGPRAYRMRQLELIYTCTAPQTYQRTQYRAENLSHQVRTLQYGLSICVQRVDTDTQLLSLSMMEARTVVCLRGCGATQAAVCTTRRGWGPNLLDLQFSRGPCLFLHQNPTQPHQMRCICITSLLLLWVDSTSSYIGQDRYGVALSNVNRTSQGPGRLEM